MVLLTFLVYFKVWKHSFYLRILILTEMAVVILWATLRGRIWAGGLGRSHPASVSLFVYFFLSI